MFRIKALNEDSTDESGEDEEPTLTREAQEQAVHSEYNKALHHMNKKEYEDAKAIFQQLLSEPFLLDVTQQEGVDIYSQPTVLLKYSCMKNMGTTMDKLDDVEGSLTYYIKASEIDNSDVSLWYYMGRVAMKGVYYELAAHAFSQGLERNPRHWPCLDNIISVLYALDMFVPCLLHIFKGLEMDPHYTKALALRDHILKTEAYILPHYETFCKGCDLKVGEVTYDLDMGRAMVEEAQAMRQARSETIKKQDVPVVRPIISLLQPLEVKSWLKLGESLIKLHRNIERREAGSYYCCPVDLRTVREDFIKASPLEEEVTVCETTETVAQAAEPAIVVTAKESGEVDEGKGKKRRMSLEQWAWGQRRSARVRSTVRREDCNLEEVLRGLVPQTLLSNEWKTEKLAQRSLEGDLDMAELCELLQRQESLEEKKREETPLSSEELYKILIEEGYFCTVAQKVTPADDTSGHLCEEEREVEVFLEQNNLHDIIHQLFMYVNTLSGKWRLRWPPDLVRVFMEVYERMRRHVGHPSPWELGPTEEEVDPAWHVWDAWATLLHSELFLDRWLEDADENDTTRYIPDIAMTESLEQLMLMAPRDTLFGEDFDHFFVRYRWLRFWLYLMGGNVLDAMDLLEDISFQMLSKKQDLRLPNCKHYNVISPVAADKLRSTLDWTLKLCQLEGLYKSERYEEVTNILEQSFRSSEPHRVPSGLPAECTPTVDRLSQLTMFLEALGHLGRHTDLVFWGAECLYEALNKYLNCEEEEQSRWSACLTKLLTSLQDCISEQGLKSLDRLHSEGLLGRLVQSLAQIVCLQMDAPDTVVELPLETISPWILIHKVFIFVLQREYEGRDVKDVPEGLEAEEVPVHLEVLFTAHEFLARRSWCCTNNGELLLYTMGVVLPVLADHGMRPHWYRLRQEVEQVVFCLYAHPNKKTKSTNLVSLLIETITSPHLSPRLQARYLQDHGVPPIPLLWEQAMQLFQFYHPEVLPEFDSNQIPSISSDVEVLFRRIIALVPEQCSPGKNQSTPHFNWGGGGGRGDFGVNKYIEGSSVHVPLLEPTLEPFPVRVSNIYYLLGDHYFKNNDWGKAIRHYLLDVCVNPVRLDSWAGMALARGSQLENRLNSQCEPVRDEADFLRQALAARQCFQRALDIDSSNSLLWVEYGSFVYMVHSFCSTVLKQVLDNTFCSKQVLYNTFCSKQVLDNTFCSKQAVNLSMEMFSRLESEKEEMLKLAVQCFTWANKVWWAHGVEQDERWLHHYMLGKVEEKQQDTPLQSLQQYSKALENLVANQAIFTRSVNYDNPDHLSMEAVEVVYRIHACVLKYLEQHEGRALPKQTCAAILEHLDAVRGGPFMDPLPTLPEVTRKRTAADMSDGPTGDPLVDEVIAMMEEMLDKVCAESAPKRDEEVKVPGGGGDKQEGNKDMTDKSSQEKATISGELNIDVDQNLKDDENKEKLSKDVVKAPKGAAEKGEEEKQADLRVSRESLATNNTTDTGSDNDSSSSSSSGESSSSGSESSSSSSSGSDSSDSESDSSDSDSDSGGRKTKPESVKTKKEEETGSKDHLELVQRCVWMLEECLSRFPQHYKCFYRLAHYYLNSKFHRDTTKCRQLLLGTHPIGRPHCDSVYGLFAHRKNSNFFNDVWRNPVTEIDRPGSFVSHMSRSMTLLMELLKQQKDSKLLLELAIQLNKIPDPYKKYLRDVEREQFSRQALTLCHQCLRAKAGAPPETTAASHVLLMEVYHAYRRVQKYLTGRESRLAGLLVDTYRRHANVKDVTLDHAVRFCQTELAASRAISRAESSPQVLCGTALPLSYPGYHPFSHWLSLSSRGAREACALSTPSATPVVGTSAIASQQKKAAFSSPSLTLTPRARGRPPGSRAESKPPTIPPYMFNTSSLMSSALQANFGSLVEQQLAMATFQAHLGSYQVELLRHLAATTSSISPSYLSSLTAQGLSSLTKYPNLPFSSAATAFQPSLTSSVNSVSKTSSKVVSKNSGPQVTGVSSEYVSPSSSPAALSAKKVSSQQSYSSSPALTSSAGKVQKSSSQLLRKSSFPVSSIPSVGSPNVLAAASTPRVSKPCDKVSPSPKALSGTSSPRSVTKSSDKTSSKALTMSYEKCIDLVKSKDQKMEKEHSKISDASLSKTQSVSSVSFENISSSITITPLSSSPKCAPVGHSHSYKTPDAKMDSLGSLAIPSSLTITPRQQSAKTSVAKKSLFEGGSGSQTKEKKEDMDVEIITLD
uniref:Calcineurin-binding protein cabin-1 n=1 Tax=Timema monikensis TaxID=170555 RepID=A0A7R9E0W5_9NEOP|nr:unnamed protein product [Timema monikensis]